MSRIARAVRRHSPAELVQLALRRLWTLIFRRKVLIFYRASLDRIERLPPRVDAGSDYSCTTMSVEEARTLRDAPPPVLALLAQYLEQDLPGQWFVLIRIDGDMASWAIVAHGAESWPLTETGTALPLAPSDAVWISAYTRPEYRGRHLNSTLIGESANLAARLGAERLWAWHEHWNGVPGRNMARVGMERVGTHARVRICGLNLPARERMPAHD